MAEANSTHSPAVTLTIRLLMQGKEVGSIIGKKGNYVTKIREESGAKINISDSSCPERIVTVTGSTDGVLKAFSLIARKLEEELQSANAIYGVTAPPITLRLIVPASQCGSLIGKGGSKIKEIRELTGASIQLASTMLPDSTERTVTVSGTFEAICKCIYQVCCVMLTCPPVGPTIPYRPKPSMPSVIFSGGRAYTVQGQYAVEHPDLTKLHQLALQHAPLLPVHGSVAAPSPKSTVASTSSAGVTSTTVEMKIPNDLIGSVIGKAGARINEIRQISGAAIKIFDALEGSNERAVTISGTPEAVNLAQYLISSSMDLYKTADLSSAPANSMLLSNPANHPFAIPLSQLVGAGSAPSPASSVLFNVADVPGQSHRALTTKLRAQNTSRLERNKIAPY